MAARLSPASMPSCISPRVFITRMKSARSNSIATVNIDGTLQLARSAAEAGVKNLSLSARFSCTEERQSPPFRESDDLTPRGLYGMSKAAAEAGLKALAQSSGMNITVVQAAADLRLRRARGTSSCWCKAIELGVPLPFAAIRNRRAFLAVENLASFILHRLVALRAEISISFLWPMRSRSPRPNSSGVWQMRRAVRRGFFPMPSPLLSTLLKVTGRMEIHRSLLGSHGARPFQGRLPPAGGRRSRLDEGLRLALPVPV